MKRLWLVIFFNLFTGNCIAQYLPDEMKEGLKGKVSHVSTTIYYDYPKGISSRDLKVFDKNGCFTNAVLYDTKNQIKTDFTFQYDKYNRLISYKQYAGKAMQMKVVNFYDAAGRVIVQNNYQYQYGYPQSHFKLVKYFYSYQKNQPVKIHTEQYGVDKSPYNQYFKYNVKGQKIEGLREAVGLTSASKKIYLYNKKGEVSELIETDLNNPKDLRDTTLYEYADYDKVGNWHKKKEINLRAGDKVLMNTTMRKISYFK